jgi:hypothetical protein
MLPRRTFISEAGQSRWGFSALLVRGQMGRMYVRSGITQTYIYIYIYIWPKIDSRLNDPACDELKAGYKFYFWNSEKTPERKRTEVNFPPFCWIY